MSQYCVLCVTGVRRDGGGLQQCVVLHQLHVRQQRVPGWHCGSGQWLLWLFLFVCLFVCLWSYNDYRVVGSVIRRPSGEWQTCVRLQVLRWIFSLVVSNRRLKKWNVGGYHATLGLVGPVSVYCNGERRESWIYNFSRYGSTDSGLCTSVPETHWSVLYMGLNSSTRMTSLTIQ